jgi:hypothetical protein
MSCNECLDLADLLSNGTIPGGGVLLQRPEHAYLASIQFPPNIPSIGISGEASMQKGNAEILTAIDAAVKAGEALLLRVNGSLAETAVNLIQVEGSYLELQTSQYVVGLLMGVYTIDTTLPLAVGLMSGVRRSLVCGTHILYI